LHLDQCDRMKKAIK